MIINKGKGKGKERVIEWEFDVSGIPENPKELEEAVENGQVSWKALHAFLVHSLPIKVRQAVSSEPSQEEVEEAVQRILVGGSKRRNKAEIQAELAKLTGLPSESFGGKVEDLERALEALKGQG